MSVNARKFTPAQRSHFLDSIQMLGGQVAVNAGSEVLAKADGSKPFASIPPSQTGITLQIPPQLLTTIPEGAFAFSVPAGDIGKSVPKLLECGLKNIALALQGKWPSEEAFRGKKDMIKRRVVTFFASSVLVLALAGSCSAGQVAQQDTSKKFCSGWSAWRDSQPINKPTLHVAGNCVFPTTGYSVKLQPSTPQGFNPNIYLLDLVIRIPVDKAAQHVVNTVVKYSEQTDKLYTEVQIMPDNVPVPVKEVSAATAPTDTGRGDEKTIRGCVYSIQDCTVLITKDGQYYHLSGPDDAAAKAKAAKTMISVTATPGTWDDGSASCKSENVKPIMIESITVTRMRCADAAPASSNAEDTGSPCSEWKAWHDSQPGIEPTLYVEGMCTFTTGGYSVELKPAAPPNGVFLKIRVLDLVIHKPSGIVTQVITNVPVKYSEETKRLYPQVEIKPDGIYVPVKEVSAANVTPATTNSLQPDVSAQRVRNFTSTTDRNGSQHPVTADTRSNGVIKCTSAAGNNPRQYPPSCFVLGQILPPGQTTGTGVGGSMTLTCNGQAPLTCTVQITD
jgi:hypothetical protein